MARRADVRWAAVLLGCLLSLPPAGCGGRKEALRGNPPPPAPTGPRVAVAPLENRSNDLGASGIIRGAFVEEILRRGWNVLPVEESDRLLRERLGVSYGGQLEATTPVEVCRALEVRGVFYGTVEEWNKTTTGIYNHVTVTAAFRLYGESGELLWEDRDTREKTDIPRGGQNLGAEVIVHALGNLLLNPMTPYGREAARNLAGRLPSPGLLGGTAPGTSGEQGGNR